MELLPPKIVSALENKELLRFLEYAQKVQQAHKRTDRQRRTDRYHWSMLIPMSTILVVVTSIRTIVFIIINDIGSRIDFIVTFINNINVVVENVTSTVP